MSRPRIALDGFNLAMPHGTGIATYGLTLAGTLAASGFDVEGLFGIDLGRDPRLFEVLFFDRLQRDRSLTRWQRRLIKLRDAWATLAGPGVNEVPLTASVDREPLQDRLPDFARLWSAANLFHVAELHFRLFRRFLGVRMPCPPDIMHWTYPIPIRVIGARNIYTIHDLVPLRMPYTTLDEKQRYQAIIDGCMQHGDRICTVSETSRDDIVSRFPDKAAQVVNTYQCAPIEEGWLSSDPRGDAGIVKGLFGLEAQGYFLYFGAVDPKKNLGRIIEAFLGLETKTPLVIVGGRDWGTEDKLNGGNVNVYGRAVDDRIIRLRYLPRHLLFQLARGAKAVLFPSLYEGFGLPALEAMCLGTPLIASTGGALPEIVGEGGLLVDPYDIQALAQAIRSVDEDAPLRARLSEAGRARSGHFSRARYADRLHALYEPLLSP